MEVDFMSNAYDVSFGRINPIINEVRAEAYNIAVEKIIEFLRTSGVEFEKFTCYSTDITIYPKDEIEDNFVFAAVSMAKLLAENSDSFQSPYNNERYYCFDNILNTHYSLNIIIDFTHFNKSI